MDAEPDGKGGGILNARCFVNRTEGFADSSIKLSLFDPNGKLVAESTKPVDIATPIYGMGSGRNYRGMRPVSESAFFELSLKDVKPWSFDKPNLYRVVFTLIDPDGEQDFEAMSASERYP